MRQIGWPLTCRRRGWARCNNETKQNMFSQELEMRKESRLNSVKLVKRKIQISYKLEYNNFML